MTKRYNIFHTVDRRGYTLIVVLMIMILLSGLGIIAVNNVSVGLREANLQNLTTNSFQTTDSAVNLFSQYAGYSASPIVMKYNTDFLTYSNDIISPESRANWAYQIKGSEAMNMMLNDSTAKSPFTAGNAGSETWDKNRAVDFDLVIRDMTDGMSAPGYSEEFCFKRVLIGGESRVGMSASNPNITDNGNSFARTVTAQQTLIGPIRCSSN